MLVSIRSEGVQIVINTMNLTSVLIGSHVNLLGTKCINDVTINSCRLFKSHFVVVTNHRRRQYMVISSVTHPDVPPFYFNHILTPSVIVHWTTNLFFYIENLSVPAGDFCDEVWRDLAPLLCVSFSTGVIRLIKFSDLCSPSWFSSCWAFGARVRFVP